MRAIKALGRSKLCVVTLPLVGPQLWLDWVGGLQAYQVSQQLLPSNLYGYGLARYMPFCAAAAAATSAQSPWHQTAV